MNNYQDIDTEELKNKWPIRYMIGFQNKRFENMKKRYVTRNLKSRNSIC